MSFSNPKGFGTMTELTIDTAHDFGYPLYMDPTDPAKATLVYHQKFAKERRSKLLTPAANDLEGWEVGLEWDKEGGPTSHIRLSITIPDRLSYSRGWEYVRRVLHSLLSAPVCVMTNTHLLIGVETMDEQTLRQIRSAVNRRLS